VGGGGALDVIRVGKKGFMRDGVFVGKDEGKTGTADQVIATEK